MLMTMMTEEEAEEECNGIKRRKERSRKERRVST